MKVHFSASIEHIDKRIDTYRTICNIVRDHGDKLMRDWIEEVYAHRASRYRDSEAVDIARLTRAAIAECDIAIF